MNNKFEPIIIINLIEPINFKVDEMFNSCIFCFM